jgi:prolyl oligopeptidase
MSHLRKTDPRLVFMEQLGSLLTFATCFLTLTAALLVPGFAEARDQEDADPAQGIDYPETRKVDQADDYHGVRVEDPYRWLEDDVRESDDVRSWVEAQN